MKWKDLVNGNIPKDLLDQFIDSLPKDFFIFLIKTNALMQKEFSGFRIETLSKERIAFKIAPHFYKDVLLRQVMLEEWVFRQQKVLSSLESMSVANINKELSSLIKKHGFINIYLALLYDLRTGTEKLVARLEQEVHQKNLWRKELKSEESIPDNAKLLGEIQKKLEELEEQRERLYLEIEREKDSRAKLENLYFSLKKENKDQKRELEEAASRLNEMSRKLNSIQNQESKSSEYISQINALQKNVEKLEHDLKKEKQLKDEMEIELQEIYRENERIGNDLLSYRNQIQLLQATIFAAEREKEGHHFLPGTTITIVCDKQEIPSSYFKIAGAMGINLLIHSTRMHDQKLDDYIRRSLCVFLYGDQFSERLRGIVQSLCSSRQIPWYQLPSMDDKIFEDILSAVSSITTQKSAGGKNRN
ncbi:MAG: hypothetical protein AB1756_04640 [Acidobacteriota bacterium]